MLYDGRTEFTHLVVKGESLISILHHYRQKHYPVVSWEPVYLLTKLRTRLWIDKGPHRQNDNPALIYPGDLLVFPRSQAGYNHVISRIQELASDVRHAPSEVRHIKKEAEEFGERLDLLADALKLVVSCGGSAAASLGEAKGAVGLVAKLKLAHANGMSREIARKLAEFVVEHANTKAFGSRGDTANHAYENSKQARELYLLGRAKHLAKEALHAGEAIGRGAEMILEWISPSMIAKKITHFDDEMAQAGQMERNTKNALLQTLSAKVNRLTQEREFLYNR